MMKMENRKSMIIKEELFDYDDSKYDAMSAIDIMNLQNVLCEKDTENKED